MRIDLALNVNTSGCLGMFKESRSGTVLIEPTRLPPHVIREIYASNASEHRLYGGRMTDKRLQVVGSITTEAIEKLHK